MDDGRRVVGPGALVEDTADVRPLLEGASEYEYVEILNPLSDDFMAQVAVTRNMNMPVRIVNTPEAPTGTVDEGDLAKNYGLSGFRNPDLQGGRKHITNRVLLPSGQTVRLPGNDAQVVVKQLVNEIMQREGKKLKLADPTARKEVEDRIILRRGNIQDFMNAAPVSVSDQLRNAIKDTNVTQSEFSDARTEVSATEPTDNGSNGTATQPERRSPGRPKSA